MIHMINEIAEAWFSYMVSATLQATFLALLILGIVRIRRGWSPALRHALLLLALCKFVIPPTLSLPTGLFNYLHIDPQQWSQPSAAPHRVAAVVQNTLEPVKIQKPGSGTQPGDLQFPAVGLPPKPALTIKGMLLLLHLTGALLILALAVLQKIRLCRQVLRSTPVREPALTEAFDSLCSGMKLFGGPRLLISNHNNAPITFGLWKPVVLMPQAIITALPTSEIKVIFAHELAHHRRLDPWLAWFQLVIASLWWFNPVFWLLSRSIRSIREDCCDDVVIASGLASREAYCRTLLQAARAAHGDPMRGAALAYIGEPQPMRRRIERIMSSKFIRVPKLAWTGMLSVVVLSMVLLPGVEPRIVTPKSGHANPVNEQGERRMRNEMPMVEQPAASAGPQKPQPARENILANSYRKWLDEDVVYIINNEEKSAFIALKTDQERGAFIEQFWARRNPNPRSGTNAFKEEHYRRIAYANEHFASAIPGWQTDRGRIHILYGKPDELESHPMRTTYSLPALENGETIDTYPFERWWYSHIDGIGADIEIEFIDKNMTGEYRMAMSPDEKDALLNVPNSGLRLEDSNRPGKIQFEDLKSVLRTNVPYNLLPFDLKPDYIKFAADKTLVRVTIELRNKELDFKKEPDSNLAVAQVYGVVTGLNGRIMYEWEDVISVEYSDRHFEQGMNKRSKYQKTIGLPPGQYQLDLVLKDLNSQKVGSKSLDLSVP